MARVKLEKINKVYPNGFQAVFDFDLDIHDGEFMVFVGPSGCGKSTTLRMIAGLEEISGGSLLIGEKLVNNVMPKDRNIAMVFQNYALYPHMTVYKNMAFGLKLRRMPKTEIDQRVKKAAKILGIESLLERKPKQLSGGQRQRVAVGRAIVRDPYCFLFDEPLSNLDAKLRVEMRAELKALHHRLKTTTVYVTHDQEEAMTLGDRICVMKLGYIQQVATPLEMYWHPVNHFVAGFVGTPPMNFMEGTLEAEGEDLWFHEGEFVRKDPEEDGSPVLSVNAGKNRLKVPIWAKPSLEPYIGKHLIIGLRPEIINLTANDRFGGDGASLDLTCRVIETLGEKMDVYMYTEQHEKIVARVNATMTVKSEMPLTVHLDMNRVHFFEAEGDQKNIALDAEKAHIESLGLMAG